MKLTKLLEKSKIKYLNEKITSDGYIYHGTGKGQALSIQRDGYMKPNNTGEDKASISFTNDLDYAKYYAKSKGGSSKMVILRTKLDNSFKLSPRIAKNKGDEYVTFDKLSADKIEIMSNDGRYHPLNKLDVIFDEPLNV